MSPRSARVVFAPGMLVGGAFRILRVLGEGGMGQVYEAEDVQLNRRVALKVAWPGMPSVRFEASVLAALRHPAMVTVHQLGQHEGVDFLVMERIYGLSLQARLDHLASEGGMFELREALDVLTRVAEGLSVLHYAGVSHRDLKPENVMLAPDGRVVLMDLGVAMPEVDAAATKQVAGSVGYLAPEALKNEIRRGHGHLVDLYALGVIAYRMIAGRAPFEGIIEKLIVSHVIHTPPSLAAARPEAPPALIELVATLMAKAPEDRPATADLVAEALRRIRTRDTTDAPPSTSIAPRDAVSVLIVDDDPVALQIMVTAARSVRDDLRVTMARSGEEALRLLERSTPQLLLVDLNMPQMSGLELILQLRGRRRTKNTAIVIVSAAASQPDRTLLRELGVRRFVEKGPRLIESVRAEVARACERYADVRRMSG